MNQRQIIIELRKILNRADVDSNGLVTRKMSCKHEDEIEVLLEHLSLLVADLRFDAVVSRRELFQIRAVLEE